MTGTPYIINHARQPPSYMIDLRFMHDRPLLHALWTPEYEQRIEGHKLGFVRVLARLGRTMSDQQRRLNGLRVCDTRMSCICTNVDYAQVSCTLSFHYDLAIVIALSIPLTMP